MAVLPLSVSPLELASVAVEQQPASVVMEPQPKRLMKPVWSQLCSVSFFQPGSAAILSLGLAADA